MLEWLRLDTHSAALCSPLEEASSWGYDLMKLNQGKCSSSRELPQEMEWQGGYPHLPVLRLSPVSEVGSREAKGPAHVF